MKIEHSIIIRDRHLSWLLDKIIELERDVKHYKHQLECTEKYIESLKKDNDS